MPKSTARYWPSGRDEDVAGMHVGMKETVAKRLGEKDLDAIVRELLHVHARFLQGRDIAYRDAGDAFHHHHIRAREVPVDLWHVQQCRILEIGAQATGIRRLAHQVEFGMDGLAVLIHHFTRTQATRVRRIALGQACQRIEQRQITLNNVFDAGAQHLTATSVPSCSTA